MYRRILVPVDGSPVSERALQEAITLAGGAAQFCLVHVLEEIYLMEPEGYAQIDMSNVQQALRQSGERMLATAAAKVQQSGASAETRLVEASGARVPNLIESEARQWHADLIVLGTHGRSGLDRLLLGSVAEGVARVASVPVLLVRST